MTRRWLTLGRDTSNIRLAMWTMRCMVRLRLHGVSGFVTCHGPPPVVHSSGECRLGRLAIGGAFAPVELGATKGGILVIGDRVAIDQGATIVATKEIRIGDDCRIVECVAIYDTNYHPTDQQQEIRSAPVRIGRNVFLARAVIVLPGVTIGDHSAVGAGSVVTRDIPPKVLAAGNPARVIRELSVEAPDLAPRVIPPGRRVLKYGLRVTRLRRAAWARNRFLSAHASGPCEHGGEDREWKPRFGPFELRSRLA